MNSLCFIYKFQKLYTPVLVWLQALTYNKVKNFLISLFVTFIIINICFSLLYYFCDYNPSLYIRAFINIFFILPIVRNITKKTSGGNYYVKSGKGKLLHAAEALHFCKTGLYSYTFSVIYI